MHWLAEALPDRVAIHAADRYERVFIHDQGQPRRRAQTARASHVHDVRTMHAREAWREERFQRRQRLFVQMDGAVGKMQLGVIVGALRIDDVGGRVGEARRSGIW